MSTPEHSSNRKTTVRTFVIDARALTETFALLALSNPDLLGKLAERQNLTPEKMKEKILADCQ